MIRSTVWLAALTACCATAQYAIHSPVVHHGNAQSFQTVRFGAAGQRVAYTPAAAAQVQYTPAAAPQVQYTPAQVVAPVAARRPVAAPVVVRRPVAAPVAARRPVAAPAAARRPVAAPVVRRPVPAVRVPSSPAAVRVPSIPAVQAALKKDYRPDPSTYTYDYSYNPDAQPSFKYDPANPEKTFDYKYNYNGPKYEYESADIPVNVPAAQLVDSAIAETRTQGAKIVRVLQKLTNNKVIARAIQSTANSDDPCAFIPSDLDATVEELINGITNSRESLINVIAAVQDMKRNEDDTAKVIKSASQAVLAIEPLLPVFRSVFKTNPACDNSIEATVNKFDGVGNVLDTLGRTNLVSRNSADKIRLIQGGQASRVISRTAANLDKIQFMNLCSDSPTFTTDVFAGVGELLSGLKDISSTFSDADNSVDAGKLDQTVNLLKEGAELLKDLDFESVTDQKYVPSGDCVTSLPDVARSLAEVADLVDVIEPDSLKALGRRR